MLNKWILNGQIKWKVKSMQFSYQSVCVSLYICESINKNCILNEIIYYKQSWKKSHISNLQSGPETIVCWFVSFISFMTLNKCSRHVRNRGKLSPSTNKRLVGIGHRCSLLKGVLAHMYPNQQTTCRCPEWIGRLAGTVGAEWLNPQR